MKQNLLCCLILGIYLIGLTGCGGRIVHWAQDCFNQGDNRTEPVKPHSFVRSAFVYDQFTTVGSFEALWLSDGVKTSYARALMRKQGKEEQAYRAFLRRQLEENKHFILLYVLISYEHTLGEPRSEWSLFLDIDGQHVIPIEVKPVDLDSIYKSFFANKFNCFKVAYRAKFDANDGDDIPFINDQTKCISLVCRSAFKEVRMCWDAQDKGPDGQAVVPHDGPWDESLEEILV
jgi:hypothetical protein